MSGSDFEISTRKSELTEGGYWRWTLADPPGVFDDPSYLPKEIFDRLDGDDLGHPWLYRSKAAAVAGLLHAHFLSIGAIR